MKNMIKNMVFSWSVSNTTDKKQWMPVMTPNEKVTADAIASGQLRIDIDDTTPSMIQSWFIGKNVKGYFYVEKKAGEMPKNFRFGYHLPGGDKVIYPVPMILDKMQNLANVWVSANNIELGAYSFAEIEIEPNTEIIVRFVSQQSNPEWMSWINKLRFEMFLNQAVPGKVQLVEKSNFFVSALKVLAFWLWPKKIREYRMKRAFFSDKQA